MGKRLLWSFRDKTRRKKFCKRNVLYLIYSSIFTSKHCNIRATLVQRNELTVFIETLKYYFYQLWLYFTSKNSCQGIFWRFWHMQYWAHTPPTCSESKKQHLSSSCNPAVCYMGGYFVLRNLWKSSMNTFKSLAPFCRYHDIFSRKSNL